MLTELVALPGGSFRMGSTSFYPEEAPVHTATVAALRGRATPGDQRPVRRVRRRHRLRHRRRTRHSTPRCIPGWPTQDLCPARWCSGRRPGPSTCGTGGSGGTGRPARAGVTRSGRTAGSCDDRPDHPVVQVAYPDAAAYARVGGPAAADRGGVGVRGARRRRPRPTRGATTSTPGGELMANTWQGRFPYRNDGALGWTGTSPVGTFPAERVRAGRHDRQRVGVDDDARTPRHHRAVEPARRAAARRPRARSDASTRRSRAGRICARRSTATATGLPRGRRSRRTARPPTSASAASSPVICVWETAPARVCCTNRWWERFGAFARAHLVCRGCLGQTSADRCDVALRASAHRRPALRALR